MVPLIRKHFDFLVLEFGFECTRTWDQYMSRYQGAEYKRADLTIQVEQPDSPILEVRVLDEIEGKERVRDLREIAGEEAWSKWPEGDAWPRPLEQDERALQFLAVKTKEVLPGLLNNRDNRGL